MNFNESEILYIKKIFKNTPKKIIKKDNSKKNIQKKNKSKKQLVIYIFKEFKKYFINLIIILFSFIIFFFFKILSRLFPFSNKDEFSIFLKEIELKNEKYEKSNLTTLIIKNRIEKLKIKKEIKMNLSYIDILNISKTNNSLDKISSYANNFASFSLTENDIRNFNISLKPIISIIIPIYNSQNYIINLLNSIQRESLNNIEIIYIDDCSTDNSTKIIQNLQKKDKRIILLKNKKNRGEFYSRNKGAFFSRGEYLLFIDSDDLITGNILIKAYNTAKANNIDIVQFKLVIKYLPEKKYEILNETTDNNIIYQPALSDQMYYGKGILDLVNYFIFNKIIKNEIFLKSLIYIGDDYLKEKIYANEDNLQLFAVLRVANSLKFIDDIGYIKMSYENKKSQTNYMNNIKNANRIFHDIFLEIQFLFDKTKNNIHDKAISLFFLNFTKNLYSPITSSITQGFEFIEKVFDLLLNSEYFSFKELEEIKAYKNLIMTNKIKNGEIKPNS